MSEDGTVQSALRYRVSSQQLQHNYRRFYRVFSIFVWPQNNTVLILKVRPHRTRSAAADCGLCLLRNVTF